jgi:hypothetical protein
MACPQVADGGNGLQIWRIAANILNKQSQMADGGGPSALELGRGLTNLHHKNSNLLRNISQSLGPGQIVWLRVLVGKPEGEMPCGRPSCRWEDGIKMDLREIGLGVVLERIHQAWDRDCWRAIVNAVMNLWVLAPQS